MSSARAGRIRHRIAEIQINGIVLAVLTEWAARAGGRSRQQNGGRNRQPKDLLTRGRYDVTILLKQFNHSLISRLYGANRLRQSSDSSS